jgi:hypothetical protein
VAEGGEMAEDEIAEADADAATEQAEYFKVVRKVSCSFTSYNN